MTKEEFQMNDVNQIIVKQQESNLSYVDKWNEHSFSFLDLLQTSSVYDFISDGSLMNDEECGKSLEKHKDEKPNIRPYIEINDLNNSKDEPHLNKPKRAIEVGIEIEF